MFILFVIFLFIFIPLLMLILHLLRPRTNFQGFIAAFTALAGLILVLLAHADIPRSIPLWQWQPDSLFTLSPSLLIDDSSWFFSLALTSLSLSVVITSITQLGHNPSNIESPALNQVNSKNPSSPIDESPDLVQPPNIQAAEPVPGWLLWASILTLTSLGLIAATAGNLVTLLLAWTALDLAELLILLGQMTQSRTRERIILAFSARMAGLCIVLFAGVALWSAGAALKFDAISQPVSTLLVLAAGLRLGVLPLHLPFTRGLPIGRSHATILRLVPAASSFVLLMRVSNLGVLTNVAPFFLGLAILAGIYAAINWLRAKDELEGRPYWLLGASSLVVLAAILRLPEACLAWSIASLLSGGFIFSLSIRHKNLLPLLILGFFNISMLPLSPTWQGTAFFQYSDSLGISRPIFFLSSVFILLIQAFLIAGFIRHALQGIYPAVTRPLEHAERWVWFLYPLGLLFVVITHFFIGWLLFPGIKGMALSGWIIGPIILILSGLILYFIGPYQNALRPPWDASLRSTWDQIFSLDWLYRILWRFFRMLTKTFALVSSVLEGDGGLLWALVLFGLIFVFLQR